MKNRQYKKLLAVALMVSMIGTMTGISTFSSSAADNNTKQTVESELSSLLSDDSSSTEAKPTKDETVYAKIDGNGSVTSVTVSDQLKNVTDQSKIEDVSDLTDIQNVKGDETFNQSSNSLIWDGDGADIVYQGTAKEDSLPVGVNITYKLDGKEVSADELEGKSGHLSIRYDYTNLSKEKTGSYVPFLMATGIVIDGDVFTNITTTNARVASDGDRDLVIGLGLPGVSSELEADDLNIPDYFEMEADVTNYTAPQAITLASNEMFNSLSTDGFDSIGDLEDAMSQLSSASSQLVSGSGELRTGLDTLLSSSGTLVSGIDQLATGGTKVADGSAALSTGLGKLSDGTKLLSDGTSELKSKSSALVSGGTSLVNGASALNAGIDTAAAGVADLKTQLATAQSTATLVNNGIATVKGSVDQLQGAAATLSAGLTASKQNVQKEVTLTGDATVSGDATVAVDTTAARNAIAGLVTAGTLTQDQANSIINNLPATATGNATVTGNTSLTDTVNVEVSVGETALGTAAAQIAGGLSGISSQLAVTAPSAAAPTPTLGYAAYGLDSGLNSTKLNTGLAQLEGTLTVATDANGNLTTTTLKGGATALEAGTQSLAAQIPSLIKGISDLDEGAGTANAGASDAKSGASTLASGAAELSTGLNSLQSKTPELVSGITQLDDGAAQLNDGMIEFDETGIQKLVSVFDGDIDEVLDKLNGMLDSSRSYKNFSGISDNMEGNVKFIFVSNN